MTAIKTKQNALRDFDLDSLDAYEQRRFKDFVGIFGYSKEDALIEIIQLANGDYTQLSNDLAILAQEIDEL